MKLSEIYKILNTAAPKRLSDEYCALYEAYDNSGILIDAGDEIKGALFTLDFSLSAIEKAIALNANLIVTHHPAIYGKIGEISVNEVLGKKLALCLRNGISIVSQHLNLDVVQGGIDESLCEGILRATASKKGEVKIACPVTEKDGYGRAYEIEKTTLESFVQSLKKEFKTDRVVVYGDYGRDIRRVASFCGAGGDYQGVAFAKREGADVIVSADFKHHVVTEALESGLCVVALTHYASENYGFSKYYKKIQKALEIPCEFYTDDETL